jgi:protein-export membrane protein SecD/preprotein translocase SecF subunit
MPKQLRWKWIVILCVLLGCIAGIVGFPTSKEALTANWNKNIRLGLDLKGGSHIVMQIQVQDAFKAEADRAIERLGEALRKAQVGFVAMERNDPASVETAGTIEITVKGVPAEQISEFRRIAIDSIGQEWTLLPAGGAEQRFAIRKEILPQLIQDTVSQSINTMERKVNGLGVAETNIQQRGGNEGVEILIQLPGLDDPARVKGILQTSAILELNSVVSGPHPSREGAMAAHNGILPSNAKLVRGSARAGGGAENWWLVSRSPVVSGRDLRDARAEPGEMPGRWDTGFVLIPSAAERFGRFTEANINNRLAIVLDNVLLSAPVIESRISDSGRITGAATREEAADLALNLRAGSLPAGVKIIEERSVGPSLGADSIRRGIGAGLAGLLLVIASMLAYYRGAGLNAVLALLLNTIVTVAALSYFEATWTLPGIAGLVLSIGMAVDSNVLIFERIKEELRSGKRPGSAVSSGFDRALVTIIDTHVTTVVASAFLFVFGTGPVRGFAVTLVIGLIANLFTAVYVSRAIFDLQLWRNPKLEKLSIGGSRTELFKDAGIDFMRRRRLTLGISIVMIAISMAAMFGSGLQPGLDFRGGALINVRFTDKPPIDEVRGQLSDRIAGEIAVQEVPGSDEFIVGAGLEDAENLAGTREKVQAALQEKYGDRFDIRSAEVVTPKAGEQMRRQAMMATIGALGGMLIYIAFRFKWISGVAAVVATVHDVIITLGLFALSGREINLNIIAALLTLIGYSMNDKIVVFDRVRENLQNRPRTPFLELVNLSINQTLSRTLLTAGPTLLACLALYFLGGEVLNGIAFALFTGIVAGTYSSIFVASSLLVIWNGRRQRVRNAPLHRQLNKELQ